MIVFPHAKINLGLDILHQRKDGYHEIETVLYPVGLADIMEVIPVPDDDSGNLELTVSGISKDIPQENNIIRKAHEVLAETRILPGLQVHLHKLIPPGAGLGGGSSDAAFFLRALNDLLEPRLPEKELLGTSGRLGSDCPFFINPCPALATGKGDELHPVDLSLEGWHLVILWPGFSISTPEAYTSCEPGVSSMDILEMLQDSPVQWHGGIFNRFERSLFHRYPELKQLKDCLYELGAVYASLSGSGSAVYGLFREKPEFPEDLADKLVWEEKLQEPIRVPAG